MREKLSRKMLILSALFLLALPSLALTNSFKQLTPPSEVLHAQYSSDDLAFLQTPLEAMVLDRGGLKIFSEPIKNYTEYSGEVGYKSCGKYLAVSGEPAIDGVASFHLFDRTTYQKLRTFKSADPKEFSKLHSIQFHKSCSLVFTYSEGPLQPRGKWYKQLRIFDIASGLILYSRDFEEDVDSLVISSDFKHIAVTRWGRTAVWPLNKSAPAYYYFDEAHSTLQTTFEPDSDHLVVLSNDGFTHHNIPNQTHEVSSPSPEQLDAESLDRIPNSPSKVLARAYRTSNLIVYDMATKQFATLATGLKRQVDVLCFNPSGTHLAAISGIDLAIVNISTGAVEKSMKLDPVYPTLCTLSSAANKLIIGTSKNGAREYEL